MIVDLLQFTGFMIFLGTFSFGGIIVVSLICEKHRVIKTEEIQGAMDSTEIDRTA